MPASTRVLVVDSDATSQGDIQRFLVSRRFVVLGGADMGEESAVMARAFQPEVVLLSLDDGQESYYGADLVAREFPETRLIAYTRRRDTDSMTQSVRTAFRERPVRIVPASEKALLAAIESALMGPEEPVPITVEDDHQEIAPVPPAARPHWEVSVGGWAGQSRQGAEPFLRHFADLASEWLLTRSPQAEERLLAALAEDVQAPSFGGRGRDAVRQGLKALAWRLGGDFRIVLSELHGEPALTAMVETRDGRWHRAGRFVVRAANGSAVSYLDYRVDEPSGEDESHPTSR